MLFTQRNTALAQNTIDYIDFKCQTYVSLTGTFLTATATAQQDTSQMK